MKAIRYIRNLILRWLNAEPFNPIKELSHPRFHVDASFKLNEKKSNKSLLFHMYSKENDTLFI